MSRLTFTILLFVFTATSHAQFLKKIGDKVKQKVNQETSSLNGLPKDSSAKSSSGDKSKTSDNPGTATSGSGNEKSDIRLYSTYDFVPGDSAIFVDDLQDEELNEIPSKWIVPKGKLEVANDDGQKLITYYDGGSIFPRMKKTDYLPTRFTIEYDFKWPDYTWHFGKSYKINLVSQSDFEGKIKTDSNSNPGAFNNFIRVWNNGSVEFGDSKGQWPKNFKDESEDAVLKRWIHVAIAVNEKSLKIYLDQYRVLNAQTDGKASSVSLNDLASYKGFVLIKNFRIMGGGKNPYKQVTTDKIYIARGIQFELASAQLKPESMGEINRMEQLMKDNPELKFEIGGHASKEQNSSATVNQQLSEDRAKAVRSKMIESGIDEKRLTSKGYGDSKPIASNDTPEGRATNRRVEFVRQ